MNKFTQQIWICTLVFVLSLVRLNAQSNGIHSDILRDYNQGMSYLSQHDYQQAYTYFCRVAKMQPPSQQYNSLSLYIADAEYYSAFIASKLALPNAEKNLLTLFENTHNARKNDIAFHLASLYFDQINFAEAEKWFNQFPVSHLDKSQLEDYQFKLGYCSMESNKADKALALFSEVVKNTKSKYYSDAIYYSGVIYFNKKDYTKAEAALQSIKNAQSTKGVNYVLAQIQFLKKNYPEVIKLLEYDNTISESKHQLLGKSYFELKDYKLAEDFLAKHLTENSKISPEDMYQLAFSEYKNGNFKSAIDHFKELQLSNNFGQYAMYALADCYLKASDKQNALNAFQLASQQNQDESIVEESKFNIGKLNFDLKNYNQATDNFFDFTAKFPNSKHDKEAWSLLTQSLLFTNNYPQVIGIIEKNPKLQDGNERLYQEVCYTYAVNAYNNQDTTTALRYLRKSILNPFDKPLEAEARYLKADILYKNGQLDPAMSEYNEVYKLIQKEKILFSQNATLFNVHYGLGYCEYNKKNYDAALVQFQNCAKNYKFAQSKPISNTMQDVDLRIADLLFIKKNYNAAYEQYSKISQRRGQGYDYATLQKANIDGVKKNFKDKINTLIKLMREVPNSIYFQDAKYQLGLAYEDDKNYDMAIKTYEDIEKNSQSQEYIPKSLVRLATIYYNNLNTSEALIKYSKIAEQYTSAPEADQAIKAIKEIFIAQGKPEEYLNFMAKLPNSKQLTVTEQDSILFEAGEELYANQNYDNAIIIFNKYLDKFPKGIFSAKAHFLKAESYSAKKMYAEAVDEYNQLTVENNNPYYERALVKSAYFSYNTQKDYSKSKSFYQKLMGIASTLQNKQVAKIGLLESNYNLKNYAEVIEIAKLIENDNDISTDIKFDAIYYRVKSLYYLKNYKQALPILEQFVKDKNSKRSAECTYFLASIYHQQGDFKKSNEILMIAKDDYGSYEYWVIKYFILIGYNYHKMNDNFQAKATLESIISNYQGNEELVTEAKDKLTEINNNIKKNSKVKYK
jgi:tetratricopeptide (TPR) repeat protein